MEDVSEGPRLGVGSISRDGDVSPTDEDEVYINDDNRVATASRDDWADGIENASVTDRDCGAPEGEERESSMEELPSNKEVCGPG